MAKITIDKNKVIIGEYTDHIQNVSYTYPAQKDSVTFFLNHGISETFRVSETSVNGTQMTADNIDELLSDIFGSSSAEQGTAPSEPQENTLFTYRVNNRYIDDITGVTGSWDLGDIIEFYPVSEGDVYTISGCSGSLLTLNKSVNTICYYTENIPGKSAKIGGFNIPEGKTSAMFQIPAGVKYLSCYVAVRNYINNAGQLVNYDDTKTLKLSILDKQAPRSA